ncbi:MAG: Integral membrane protein TerC, partial [uncultured Sphingomonas sp.]
GVPVQRLAGHARLVLARLSGPGGGAHRLRSRHPPQGGPGNGHRREPEAQRLLHRHRAAVRGVGVVRAGRRPRHEILHRLLHRKGAVDRQRLRDQLDLHLLRDPAQVPVSRAAVGHRCGDCAARADDRGRRRAGQPGLLGAVHLCRLSGVHRHQDAVRRRQADGHREQPRGPLDQQPYAGHQGAARPALLRAGARREDRPAGDRRHPAVPGAGGNQPRGPGVRGGLGAGDLRHHHRHLYRLHVQHHGDPGPARAVFRAGRDGAPLPLPQVRAGAGAGIHRAQDLRGGLPARRRQVSAGAEPGRDLCADRRGHRLLAVEDARTGGVGLAQEHGAGAKL